jgi:hypothetical protein
MKERTPEPFENLFVEIDYNLHKKKKGTGTF